MSFPPLHSGGIVLCGGRSSRMGQPKHLLPWGKSTVLGCIVETLRKVVSPVVVVGSPGQEVPPLPVGVTFVQDEEEYLGPLSGLRTGLRAMGSHTDAVYLTGCDTPMLMPGIVLRILSGLTPDVDAAVVVENGFYHPLAAVYRTSLLPAVEDLIRTNELRPRSLIQRHRHRTISPEELTDIDPALLSLRNMNTWDDYQELLKIDSPD